MYNNLGPGLLESVYVNALAFELLRRNLIVQKEVPLPVYYKNEKMSLGFRIDLLINKKVLIEVKSVESIAEVHHKQILTYLRLSNLKLGILVNFNVSDINQGIYRKVNGL